MWALLLLSLACASSRHTPGPDAPATTAILWDQWGIPHIYSQDSTDLFYAFGWAQAQSHGDLLLRLMGQSRGRSAEYWGEPHLPTDRWVHTMGIPERAHRWHQAQTPEWKQYLDAFAQGINDCALEHPDLLDDEMESVLPISATDILGHAQRVILFAFVTSPGAVSRAQQAWDSARTAPPASPSVGSNGWIIGPNRSASNNTLLLANPHLPWEDLYRFYEAHLVLPEINAYGVALLGIPILGIAFNDHLGWTHTVNTHDGDDFYELTLTDGGYRWDGDVQPLTTDEKLLLVRMPDGTHRQERLLVKHSIHGPIVAESNGKALALRVVGLEASGMLAQWWDLLNSNNLGEFERVLSRLQIPMFTVLYGDGEGRIMHFFGGLTPVRPEGPWDWSGVVAGTTSQNLWEATHTYQELPRAIDPASGWLQNANDPPWTTTFPPAIEADLFPPYVAPRFMSFRAQRSALLLLQDPSISFEEMLAYKHSNRLELADRLLDDLLPMASKSNNPMVQEAAAVLRSWDRNAEATSRGTILFEAFFRILNGSGEPVFANNWKEDSPLKTPDGLAQPTRALVALEEAAQKIKRAHGRLDIEWGEVNRLQLGEIDLPANGGPGDLGIFRVLGFRGSLMSRRQAISGDSFVLGLEFSDPIRAQALLSYGNSSQAGSPFVGDQLHLFSRKELRPVWRSRQEIEFNLHSRKTF